MLKFDVVSPLRKYVNFHAELIYEDVSNDFKRIKDHQYKMLKPTNNKSEYSESFNRDVMQNVAMFEANEIMERAIRYADDGDYDNAKKELKVGQVYLDEQKENVGTGSLPVPTLGHVWLRESRWSGISATASTDSNLRHGG